MATQGERAMMRELVHYFHGEWRVRMPALFTSPPSVRTLLQRGTALSEAVRGGEGESAQGLMCVHTLTEG